jgi:hypothetical protein
MAQMQILHLKSLGCKTSLLLCEPALIVCKEMHISYSQKPEETSHQTFLLQCLPQQFVTSISVTVPIKTKVNYSSSCEMRVLMSTFKHEMSDGKHEISG